MGDLTDLSDIMSDISSKKRTEPKKNTLCIDHNIKSTTIILRQTLGLGDLILHELTIKQSLKLIS